MRGVKEEMSCDWEKLESDGVARWRPERVLKEAEKRRSVLSKLFTLILSGG
jgi:hypothetical protein